MKINNGNIVDFINYLFWKRKNEAAPNELLDSWRGLSDADIEQHLQVLFQNWGYDNAAQEQEIDHFLQSKNTANPDDDFIIEEEISPSPKTPIYDIPQRPTYKEPQYQEEYSNNYEQQEPKKSYAGIIISSILILLLVAAGYFLFQFVQYKNLNLVYVLTDNVAVRDVNGKLIARMDVYGNQANNSYSYLRALDNKDYEIGVDGKTYDYRKVLLDSINFMDYLFHRKESTSFVNTNFVTNNKNDFKKYREVFKNINNNQKENSKLTSAYRKIIIGSLSEDSKFNGLYLENTCNSNDKSLSSIIQYQIPGSSVQVVVAKLSDGQYYMLSGNNDSQVYEAPQIVYFKTPFVSDMKPLKDQDFIFKQNNNSYFLYKCNGSDTEYYAVMDGAGKIKYFKWSYDVN